MSPRAPEIKAREVTMERAGGEGDQRKQEEREGGTKISGLYRGETLEEGQPSPQAGKFRVEGGVWGCRLAPTGS